MLNPAPLSVQNAEHVASAARARRLGFRPAFLDFATMRIHHPGSVEGAKPTLIAGFERRGFFYTGSAVARACQEWPAHH